MALRSLLAKARTWPEARPHRLGAVAVLIVVLGGALRFAQSTDLSLWLDEGFTVAFARLPWDQVLGLQGAYDTHPPLYYAVVKAVSLVVPELDAARYLSVLAGTATLAVLYLLVVRIVGRPVALVACLVAAISPLAIWYSQESRQYAVTGLAVSITYLALVAFYQRPRTRWAIAYCVAVASAVYLDYSALYALAPQLAILPFVVHRHRRRAIPIIVAGVVAAVAFLPWLPNVIGTVQALGNQRAPYLEAGPTAIRDSLLSIAGLSGQGIYFAGPLASPWERWGTLDPLLAVLAIAAIVLGGIALARQRFSLLLAGALCLGTVLTGVLLSQVSPGFAPRTVSYAVLGWAILLGAAAAGGEMSIPRRVTGMVVVAAMLVISAASLQAIFEGDKQHWRDWASGVARASQLGLPVVIFPGIAPTLLDVYQPGSLAGRHLTLGDDPDLDALGSFASGVPALWVASYDISSGVTIDPYLRTAGFEPVASQPYFYSLSLNLYVRRGVILGRPLGVNTSFTPSAGASPGWDLTPGMASVRPGPQGPELTLSTPGGTEAWAQLLLPAAPRHLYSLSFEARSSLISGDMRAFLICVGHGDLLNVAPNGAGRGIPAGTDWQTLRFSVLCPDGTDQLRIDLRNAGVGALDIRRIGLFDAEPP